MAWRMPVFGQDGGDAVASESRARRAAGGGRGGGGGGWGGGKSRHPPSHPRRKRPASAADPRISLYPEGAPHAQPTASVPARGGALREIPERPASESPPGAQRLRGGRGRRCGLGYLGGLRIEGAPEDDRR